MKVILAPRCEWMVDGWPHKQCARSGSVIVDNPLSVFPTQRFCTVHAPIMRDRIAAVVCDDCHRNDGTHDLSVEH